MKVKLIVNGKKVAEVVAKPHMKVELTVLDILFPRSYYVYGKSFPYDFVAQWPKCLELGKSYIRLVLEGEKSMEYKEILLSFDRAIEWLNTLFDFFKKGIAAQASDKDPMIVLSRL